MNNFKKIVTNYLLVNDDLSIFVKPTDKKFGDYATNIALRGTKRHNISPYDYYKSAKNKLISCPLVKDVSFLNGFINFRVNAHELARSLLEYDYTNKLVNTDTQNLTAIVEFPYPNIAKPFSVGHLRSGN